MLILEQQEEPAAQMIFDRLLWTRQESENTSTIFADAVRLRSSHKRIPAAYDTRLFAQRHFAYDAAFSRCLIGWRRMYVCSIFRKSERADGSHSI